MAAEQAAPKRRITQKTSVQESLPQPLELGTEAASDAKLMAYLVTFPRPLQPCAATGERLIAPGSLLKKAVLEKFLDALAHPVYSNQWLAQCQGGVAVEMCGIWREHHRSSPEEVGDIHDHAAVLGAASFRYLPVKRALLQRHGLASHWSCTHTGYWSTVRYLAVQSPINLASCSLGPQAGALGQERAAPFLA